MVNKRSNVLYEKKYNFEKEKERKVGGCKKSIYIFTRTLNQTIEIV